MSSLEKAHSFLGRSVVKAAMTILPLAVAASSASAAVVTLDSTYSAVYAFTALQNSTNFSLLPASVGDVDGNKIVGTGSFTQGFGPKQLDPNIEITADGPAWGTFNQDTLPVAWDFTLSELLNCNICDEAVGPVEWALYYWIFFGEPSESFSTSGSGLGTFSGTGLISNLMGRTATYWVISLQINYTGVGTLFVDIPDNTLALPGGATNVIPEPGTYALMGAGLGLLTVLRRRR
jgi:hypothetical protein